MKQISLKAPAKINLYLRMMGKRKDGYNNIVTVFHRISLCDTLYFEHAARGLTLSCDVKGVPLDKSNLISKAYYLLKRKCGVLGGVRIHVEKKIPMKAGMGGASSDAATALIGINRLLNIGLTKWDLYEMGKELGADVPFFITKDRLSLGVGRGDEVVRLPFSGKGLYFVLFVFSDGLSTKDVYQKFMYPRVQMSLTKILGEVIMLPLFLCKGDVSAIASVSYNDLLKPASLLNPKIIHLIEQLKQQGVMASQMTGSGSTVYAILPTREAAQSVAKKFTSQGCQDIVIARSH